jgi:hypothetical protein
MIILTENQCPVFIYQLKSLQTGKTYNDKHRKLEDGADIELTDSITTEQGLKKEIAWLPCYLI